MGGRDEHSVLGDEEASPDRDERPVLLLRDDWEDGVAEIDVFAVARLRGVASWRCLTCECASALHVFERPNAGRKLRDALERGMRTYDP